MYRLVEDPTGLSAEWELKEVLYKDMVKSKEVVVAGLMPAHKDEFDTHVRMSIEAQTYPAQGICRIPMFLMVRSKDEAVKAMQQKVVDSEIKFKEAAAEKCTAAIKLKDCQTELKKEINDHTTAARNATYYKENANQHYETSNRLEKDLAIMRKEVGEKRWKELVDVQS